LAITIILMLLCENIKLKSYNLFILGLKKTKINTKSNLTTALLLMAMFILMLLLVSLDSNQTNASQLLKYGSIVTIVGGMTAAFIMKISKELAIKNLSATLVVSLRFYGLLIISLLALIISNPTQLLVKPMLLVELFTLALTSMALPLFLLQKALKTLSPLYASIIITAIPVLTYFLQLITGYYTFSSIKLGITILFCITLLFLAYKKKK
ncbi:hypothetical protein, partial [Aquimarina agarilytica]|uniref:hypothetical protein n=1 Tax=Aquimarina agarilytica TaxID=1087449 RepID=UPI00028874E9